MLVKAIAHAGLIPDIIDAFPDVKIAGSKVALMYLKGLTNRDFTQNPVKGGDKIELGKGMQRLNVMRATCYDTTASLTCFILVCGTLLQVHDLQMRLTSHVKCFILYCQKHKATCSRTICMHKATELLCLVKCVWCCRSRAGVCHGPKSTLA